MPCKQTSFRICSKARAYRKGAMLYTHGRSPLFRKTGCDGDHVLLGDPRINKALTHFLAKRLKRLESKVAGEKHERRIGG